MAVANAAENTRRTKLETAFMVMLASHDYNTELCDCAMLKASVRDSWDLQGADVINVVGILIPGRIRFHPMMI
jgi:hypothetical protein